MVLSECQVIEAECIFLLIDNGIISNDICIAFMDTLYHTNFEMFALLDWMLMRWVVLRKSKFHLPKRTKTNTVVTLTNLINSNST
jgi:hypothetical protein